MEYKKTVVLMWNPTISSVKESDYTEWFDGLCTFREKFFNWSVWDHEHVGYGNRFILVRVGDEKAGIVMEGLVSTQIAMKVMTGPNRTEKDITLTWCQ